METKICKWGGEEGGGQGKGRKKNHHVQVRDVIMDVMDVIIMYI